MSGNETWYKSWFDTEYYHMLYQYRDDHEARGFMSNILGHLNPSSGSSVLDLACGRGRHARFMSEHDLEVTGIDLSENNILYARRFEKENLRFIQGDMSEDLGTADYDYIFNLFTSFGYFDKPEQSAQAMQNIARALRPGGKLVIDFMNVEKVRLGLVKEEEMLEGCVKFRVRRFIRDGFIIKDIRVTDGDEQDRYEERVQMLDLDSFESIMKIAGLELKDCFGDFNLKPFNPGDSERLIMIAERL